MRYTKVKKFMAFFVTVTGLHVWITVWITGEEEINVYTPEELCVHCFSVVILLNCNYFLLLTLVVSSIAGLVCTFYTTIVSRK